MPFEVPTSSEWSKCLLDNGIASGIQYPISPSMDYDAVLNALFRAPAMRTKARNTQHGYARDLAAFLSFLHAARSRRLEVRH